MAADEGGGTDAALVAACSMISALELQPARAEAIDGCIRAGVRVGIVTHTHTHTRVWRVSCSY
eukprot:COSAG05_NODE_3163_length_2276_cov_1.106569_2_plen_63_part_00